MNVKISAVYLTKAVNRPNQIFTLNLRTYLRVTILYEYYDPYSI